MILITIMTRPWISLILCAGSIVCQTKTSPGPQPPPEVDAALRSRIKQFYQAHVDGKYRLADAVVAEESKDAFFAAAKPRYLGFEIIRINYSDDFKRADAVISCDSDWYIQGNKMKVKLASTSRWKIIDGQWYWYVSQETSEAKTPFGTMHYNTAESGESKAPVPVPALPGDPRVLAQKILEQVRAEKKELLLSSYEPSKGDVKIINGMQGTISIRADIDGKFPGLTFTLDKSELRAGESATLTIVYEPKDRTAKPALTARIYVEPTGQILPVALTFDIPPELKKLIPKDAQQKPSEQ